MSARWVGALAVSLLLCSMPSFGGEPTDQDLFTQGVKALQDGDHDKAIAAFETLADRGERSPAATYDRGLAYLARVRGKAERPGDLGRAAAAFDETAMLAPDDAEARQAADLVRAEVARRRARKRTAEVHARPTLDRLVVGLAPEYVWEWGALLSSMVLTAGLILRKAKRGPKHLAGLIATPIGLVLLLSFAPLTWYSRHLRHTTRPGVVVVPEAQIVDEHGAATGLDPIPEAARVEIKEQRGGLVLVRYGSTEGWTYGASVRALALPE